MILAFVLAILCVLDDFVTNERWLCCDLPPVEEDG